MANDTNTSDCNQTANMKSSGRAHPGQVVRRGAHTDQASSNRRDSKVSGRSWGMESTDAECRMDDPLEPICRNCRTSLFRRGRDCGVVFFFFVVALDVFFVYVVVFSNGTLIINRSLKVLRFQTTTAPIEENRCCIRLK